MPLASIEAAVDARAACPYCGLHLSRDHVIAPAAERSVTPSTSRSGSVSRNGSVALAENSAKTAALIKLLKASGPGVKSLVFSQVRILIRRTGLHSLMQLRASSAVDRAFGPHPSRFDRGRHRDLPVRSLMPVPEVMSRSTDAHRAQPRRLTAARKARIDREDVCAAEQGGHGRQPGPREPHGHAALLAGELPCRFSRPTAMGVPAGN